MRVGTKSVLFGAHCFFLHPWFVALAWWKLHGFRRVTCRASGVSTSLLDPRLWLCFAVHDLGYWGRPNMDGPEGEFHPGLGARILYVVASRGFDASVAWHDFVYYHSRFLAKRDGRQPSLLCAADKLAVALEPWWLYLPRVIATGEIREYMKLAGKRKYAGEPLGKYESMQLDTATARGWHRAMAIYCRRWAYEHRDGKVDTWTPALGKRRALDSTGTWR